METRGWRLGLETGLALWIGIGELAEAFSSSIFSLNCPCCRIVVIVDNVDDKLESDLFTLNNMCLYIYILLYVCVYGKIYYTGCTDTTDFSCTS